MNNTTKFIAAAEEAMENMKGIVLIDKEKNTFCLVPSGAQAITVPLYGVKTEEGIFLTEENLSQENLISAVFEEDDFSFGKFFKQEDLDEIFGEEQDVSLVSDLYVLVNEAACNEENLLSVIKALRRDGGYDLEEIILTLIKMSKEDIKNFVKEENIISAYHEIRF